MYVHVGDDVLVRSNEIIAILDKQTVNDSKELQELLDRRKSELVSLANGSFKSLVITSTHMYLSPVAIATLKKRALSEILVNS
ncbi:extracellular matrix regulator RemB [Siminovitchia sediminis]|uniref:Extracellular matrix regulator RemB n=1 Tax=Siminovitchia sediminis TaxID=1274353 RepID=A0ABW4KKW9_9BACI